MSDAYDVFLSYAHADAGRAAAINDALLERGLKVWFDETAIDDFAGITDSVTEGLGRSKALLSLYSAVYPTRRACQWELTAAFLAAEHRDELGSRVLVVNPEPDAGHIEPVELRDARFLVAPDSDDGARLAELADRIARHVGGLDRPIGAIGASQPRWYGYSAVGATRFVGRIVDMWRIHSGLNAGEAAVVTGERGGALVQVTGLGGIGKSLLAQEYALRFGAAYPGGVFWLRAADHGEGTAQRLAQVAGRDEQLRRIAIDYGLEVDGLSPEEVGAVLATALEASGAPYLWVVDDFGSEAPDELDGWLAPGPMGRTLLTTRRREYSSLGAEVALGVLSTAEGIDLLGAHLRPKTEERDAMGSLVDDLGGHALALDVAGGALRAERGVRTIEEYRQALAQPTRDELELAADLSGHLPNGHERSIASTLLRSIRLLGEPSLDFLRLAAELAADAIPAGLIVDTFALADGLAEAEARVRAVAGMDGSAALSLSEDADDEDGSRQVHTLVSRTIKFADAGVERRLRLRDAAIDALTRTLGESVGVDDVPIAPSLVVHARHLAMPAHDERLARLLAIVADHDFYRGQYESALLQQEQVEEVFQQVLGYDHRDTLSARAKIATLTADLGRLDEAIREHTTVLGGRLRAFGRDDLDTLSSINSLAEAHRERGNLDQARGLHETAIEGYVEAESPSLFVSMNNLALTLYAQGEREEPLALQEEVVRIYRELHGNDHRMTLGAVGNLAQMHWDTGDRDGACALAEEALAGHRRLLGDDHPYTLGAMVNLGSMQGELGRLAEARPIQEEAVEGYRRLFGEEHHNALTATSNLAETLRAEGEFSAARELHEQVLESTRRALSDRHPDVFISMVNLGSTFRDQGDLSSAHELQRGACDGLRSTIGAEHPRTLIVMCVFAETLRRQGDTAGARAICLEVLEVQRASLGEDHPDTQRTVKLLADLD